MTNAAVLRLPLDAKARRERKLRAKWAEADALREQARALEREIAPLQRQVSLDQGYGFTVSREKLELALKRNQQ